jgi:hypothetical protein
MKTKLFAAAAAIVATAAIATSASAAVVNFDFSASPHQNNLGTTETYTVGGLTIVASGFTWFGNNPTDLYGKHSGGNENGLGLANDPSGDHEIYYHSGWVQLDLSQLVGKVINNTLQFGTNSTTEGEAWAVYGTNTAGSRTGSVLLASGSNEGMHSLSGLGTYKYFDFVSTSYYGGKNFLITNLSVTSAVPEPATWGMMILGFGGLGVMLRRRRALAVVRVA